MNVLKWLYNSSTSLFGGSSAYIGRATVGTLCKWPGIVHVYKRPDAVYWYKGASVVCSSSVARLYKLPVSNGSKSYFWSLVPVSKGCSVVHPYKRRFVASFYKFPAITRLCSSSDHVYRYKRPSVVCLYKHPDGASLHNTYSAKSSSARLPDGNLCSYSLV